MNLRPEIETLAYAIASQEIYPRFIKKVLVRTHVRRKKGL
jgi:hypothetical protein